MHSAPASISTFKSACGDELFHSHQQAPCLSFRYISKLFRKFMRHRLSNKTLREDSGQDLNLFLKAVSLISLYPIPQTLLSHKCAGVTASSAFTALAYCWSHTSSSAWVGITLLNGFSAAGFILGFTEIGISASFISCWAECSSIFSVCVALSACFLVLSPSLTLESPS